MPTLRPNDSDAILSALRKVRNRTGVPIVFAGEADGETARLTRFIGARTDSMQGLAVAKGRGLGGHVMASGRPATVRDYEDCSNITRDYAHAVEREGLRAIISVPVMVSGVARTILYGSVRVATQLGDQVSKSFVSVAAELATEFEVRDEVDALMAACSDDVELLLDTGHLHYAGGDPWRAARQHAARIAHLHCKDIRPDVLQRCRNADTSFLEAVLQGVFTVPGGGCIDYPAVIEPLLAAGYDGWIGCEYRPRDGTRAGLGWMRRGAA